MLHDSENLRISDHHRSCACGQTLLKEAKAPRPTPRRHSQVWLHLERTAFRPTGEVGIQFTIKRSLVKISRPLGRYQQSVRPRCAWRTKLFGSAVNPICMQTRTALHTGMCTQLTSFMSYGRCFDSGPDQNREYRREQSRADTQQQPPMQAWGPVQPPATRGGKGTTSQVASRLAHAGERSHPRRAFEAWMVLGDNLQESPSDSDGQGVVGCQTFQLNFRVLTNRERLSLARAAHGCLPALTFLLQSAITSFTLPACVLAPLSGPAAESPSQRMRSWVLHGRYGQGGMCDVHTVEDGVTR